MGSRGKKLLELGIKKWAENYPLDTIYTDGSKSDIADDDDSIADPDYDYLKDADLPHHVTAENNPQSSDQKDIINMDDTTDGRGFFPIEVVVDSHEEKNTQLMEKEPQLVDSLNNPSNSAGPSSEPNKKKKKLTTKQKIQRDKTKHPMLGKCSLKCRRNCAAFSEEERLELWKKYWELPYTHRRKWMSKNLQLVGIKTRRRDIRTPNYRKKESRLYFLPKNDKSLQVCRSFFLNTLGFTNDSVITELSNAIKKYPLDESVKENRGVHPKRKKCLEDIKLHIESYNPCVSHYRRYNAPHVRYLPRDLSVASMLQDFNEKNPRKKCGRETYRKVLKEMNISLHQPKSDSCVDCTLFEQQKRGAEKDGVVLSQDIFKAWESHKTKATQATEKYKEDKNSVEDPSHKIYSMDLQKVLLLPMMPDVKDCFFTSRLVVFNETFCPLQHTKTANPSYCVVWHEGIADRSAQSIIDSIMTLMLSQRDISHFTFWADNCSAQNKNWYLFTALVVAVNAPEGPEEIKICYLTKGHTHMSADSVHGNIEKRLTSLKHIYDFEDLKTAMTSSRKNLKVIDVVTFRRWEKKKRQARKENDPLKNLKVADIVEVVFNKGSREIKFKTSFEQNEYVSVDFLQKKYTASQWPEVISNPRGIKEEKKQTIISKLVPLMPQNRRAFWKNLPANSGAVDLQTEDGQ